MTKMLSFVLILVIAYAAGSAIREARGGHGRSTLFIAQHVNNVLHRKCRSGWPSLDGSRALWIRRHLAAHRAKRGVCAPAVPWYVTKQIWAANIIGRESAGDPWPNCPDPFDGGGSWQATVDCENSGSWLDSPGYYRCGLQFDPSWERRFGRLCP